ncbi:MAG: tetraacyldisaccharide 4'-kinase [Acidobacteria bacterium]|nr:tetraacyldisaccharide 4'-kinase [Acidobacteriota bacterium]
MSEPERTFAVLRAAARLYGKGATLRRARRARRATRLARPVISVGNLAVGGRGKTPVVSAVARMLHGWGERPAVLSRGYRRESPSRDVVIVRDAERMRATLAESGDEPFMLARELPGCCVLVHPRRARAGAVAEETLGCTVHVLDDGFQHVELARDADIVLLTLDDVLHGRVLPAGRLREPVHALESADALIAVDCSAARLRMALGRTPDVPIFEVHRHLGRARALSGATDFSRLHDEPVLLVTAVAEPDRVAAELRQVGWRLVDEMTFRDHHRYHADDVRQIAARARSVGATAVVTTAKDAVKLERHLPIDIPVAVVPLEVVIEPADRFSAWLRGRLALDPEGA